jgi:hypothetical protein
MTGKRDLILSERPIYRCSDIFKASGLRIAPISADLVMALMG